MSEWSAEQVERDTTTLQALIDHPRIAPGECDAFESMLERLYEGGRPLTPRQRKWANDVAGRLDVEPSRGPEDDGSEPDTRFTGGSVPRGREVPSMVGGLAKRPPGR